MRAEAHAHEVVHGGGALEKEDDLGSSSGLSWGRKDSCAQMARQGSGGHHAAWDCAWRAESVSLGSHWGSSLGFFWR